MGTNVHLTPELERFAQSCVESGRYNNVSEVVRSGLRICKTLKQRRAAFVGSLEASRAEGERLGFSTIEEVEAEVRQVIAAARSRKGEVSFRHSRRWPPRVERCGAMDCGG